MIPKYLKNHPAVKAAYTGKDSPWGATGRRWEVELKEEWHFSAAHETDFGSRFLTFDNRWEFENEQPVKIEA